MTGDPGSFRSPPNPHIEGLIVDNDPKLISLTADIVAAHLSNNKVATGDVTAVIAMVHAGLAGLGASAEEPVQKTPAVSVRASIKPDYIVCMECGAKQKTLKRHLQTAHGMTPAQYRDDYGLPSSYPMVAPHYRETRQALARLIGLGRRKKAVEAEQAPSSDAPAEAPQGEGASNDQNAQRASSNGRRKLKTATPAEE